MAIKSQYGDKVTTFELKGLDFRNISKEVKDYDDYLAEPVQVEEVRKLTHCFFTNVCEGFSMASQCPSTASRSSIQTSKEMERFC